MKIKIFFLTIFLTLNLITLNLKANDQLDCSFTKSSVPCIEISSNISNISEFSKKSLNKTTINRQEIEESGSVDLVDVLNKHPSINITQSGPRGQQASLFMRGAGSNHTLVLINGVAINDQSTTQGLHDFGVDFIQTIQRVEIYEGPSATVFGPNAIGGAINIITTGDYRNYYSISHGTGDTNLLINQSFIEDNSTIYNFKIGGVKSETKSARFNGKEKDKTENFSTNLNFEKYLEKYKLTNSTYLRKTISEYDGSATDEIGYEGDNEMLSTQLKINSLSPNYNDQLTFYYNLYDREYDEKGVVDYYDSNSMGMKYDLNKKLDESISFGLGSEYRYDSAKFENNGSYSASTKGNNNNLSIYGNLGYNLNENLNVSYFIRGDENKITGNNLSNKINLETYYKNFIFGVSRNEGYRNPTIYELFGTDNYGYSGNKNLSPEKSQSNEVYLSLKSNDISWNIRGFKSNIFDQIEYKNNKYVNNSNNISLNQSGINSDLDIKLFNSEIEIFTSFLSSKKTNNSDQLRRPEKNYGFKFKKEIKKSLFGQFNINLDYSHYGKHFDTHSLNFSTIEIDSTDIVDVSLKKDFDVFDINFKITNLLNENYQRPHGYSQNGRLFNIGFTKSY